MLLIIQVRNVDTQELTYLPSETITNANMLAQSILGTSMIRNYTGTYTIMFDVINRRNVQANCLEGNLTREQLDSIKTVIRKRVPLFTIQSTILFECSYTDGANTVDLWVFKIYTREGEVCSFVTLPENADLQVYFPQSLLKSMLAKWGNIVLH